MPRYSGGMRLKANFNLNDKQMGQIDAVIEKVVRNVERTGKEVADRLIKTYIIEWFDEYDYHSLVNSIRFTSKHKQNKNNITISINPYVDIDSYREKPSLDRWKDKWGADLSTDSKNYVLDLQFNEGIIGLPEIWTRPNPRFFGNPNMRQTNDGKWTNPYFIQRSTSLEDYLNNRLFDEWQNEINKAINN